MWYTYTHNGILFSQKKKDVLPFATAGTNLEDVMLSKITWAQKDKHHLISHICRLLKKKSYFWWYWDLN
jgi:hypothetical protein